MKANECQKVLPTLLNVPQSLVVLKVFEWTATFRVV